MHDTSNQPQELSNMVASLNKTCVLRHTVRVYQPTDQIRMIEQEWESIVLICKLQEYNHNHHSEP